MSLTALSPLDNRYSAQLADLVPCFSQYALIYYRVRIEIEWLIFQADRPEFTHVRPFTQTERNLLMSWLNTFDEQQAQRISQIERTTDHDVKAVEYYLKERLSQTSLADVCEAVHFCCTSEDINNLAHALMLKTGIETVWLPLARQMVASVSKRAEEGRHLSMLAHTHGQPATPTTMGKELAIFAYRWQRQLKQLDHIAYLGKFNGATGNYNAHVVAYPNLPWENLACDFVEHLGLVFNPLTTQIESHDYMAELFHLLIRFNTITLDFCRDMWAYIGLGYFHQQIVANQVGSSTMPHKVNPIYFENAEANLGISTALLEHLATKLPISRLQRDLSDSSAIRNIGPAIGHACLSLQSTIKGLNKTEINRPVIQNGLNNEWEILGEAVQTVMRKAGLENPYEQMKALTRGTSINRETLHIFIQNLDLPESDRQHLLSLTPETYIGLAPQLVNHIKQ